MTAVATPAAPVVADTRIACKICGATVHSIQLHLRNDHSDLGMTLADYQTKYPGAQVLSELAKQRLAEQEVAKARAAKAVTAELPDAGRGATKEAFNVVFGLGKAAAAMGASGNPIPVTMLDPQSEYAGFIPDLDPNYVYNIDILKTLMMGLEMAIPTYLWGHSGTGKTTIYEQICARTHRPMIRVQHTANMEEEHIVGGWRLRDGKTVFELGLLALAMKHGWLYLADEYDFGRPEVNSVYQAVLEGKPLIIKEADPENRVIRPHINFRFAATGNTNGQGDESGLYQGTNLQNAANYERFGVTEHMLYMDAKLETRLVSLQAGIPTVDAAKLVDFANRVRSEFDAGKVGMPISPRSLLFAAQLGVARNDYRIGIEKSFINRLSPVDRESVGQVAQRVFG